MSLVISDKENYKDVINSNLYDYIIISDNNIEYDQNFIDEFNNVINEYSPDVIYSDYSILHKDFEERVYCKSIIFTELKSPPNFKKAALKISLLKKYGIESERLTIRPENNLIIWHIPKLLFKIKGG